MFSTPLENNSPGFHTPTMFDTYDLNAVPRQHLLACGAKLVAMLIHESEKPDLFASILAIQGAVEVFAAHAATPLEREIAQAMRAMAEELLRRNPDHRHMHGEPARRFIDDTQFPRLRFRRKT